jgi:hypothetical protein
MTKKSAAKKHTAPAAPKPEPSYQENREWFIREQTRAIEYAREGLAAFVADINGSNPMYAFEWSDKHFTQAAEFTVATILLKIVTSDTITTGAQAVEAARGYADQAVRDGLQASSTSMPSNLMKKRLGETWHSKFFGFYGTLAERLLKMYPTPSAACTEFAD